MSLSAAAGEHAGPLDHAAVRSIIVGIMLAMLLGALDQTIVATAMPTIGRDLGDVGYLPWIITAYLLSSTAVTPLYGKLSDIHGRRPVLLAAIGLFVLGSVACALAPTMTLLILARGLQGLGGGGLISLAQTIIGDVVSPRERGRYQGYIAAVFTTSSVAGPVLGGVFAEHLHWSVIFWINLPIGGLALYMTGNALRRLPRHERRHRLDLAGAGLMVAGAIAFLLALTWGGQGHAWGSASVLAPLGLAALLWAAFVVRLMTAPEPFLPLSILTEPVVASGTASASCVMGTFIGLTVYAPVYLEVGRGLSASDSGLALIPLMAGVVVGATLAGRLMTRVRRYRRAPVLGLGFAVAGVLLLAALPGSLPLWAVEVLFGVIGVGLGTLLPVTTVSVQNAVALSELGTATGTMNFFRALGGSVAVAAFGTVLMAGGDPALPGAAGGDPAAFGRVFLAAAIGLAAGLAALLVMEERPLRDRMPPAEAPARAAPAGAAPEVGRRVRA